MRDRQPRQAGTFGLSALRILRRADAREQSAKAAVAGEARLGTHGLVKMAPSAVNISVSCRTPPPPALRVSPMV